MEDIFAALSEQILNAQRLVWPRKYNLIVKCYHRTLAEKSVNSTDLISTSKHLKFHPQKPYQIALINWTIFTWQNSDIFHKIYKASVVETFKCQTMTWPVSYPPHQRSLLRGKPSQDDRRTQTFFYIVQVNINHAWNTQIDWLNSTAPLLMSIAAYVLNLT